MIAIITLLLRRFGDAVAAVAQSLPLTVERAVIPALQVAVITLFIGIEESITATGEQGLFPLTERGTPVTILQVAVITLLSCFSQAIAADRRRRTLAVDAGVSRKAGDGCFTLLPGIDDAIAAEAEERNGG